MKRIVAWLLSYVGRFFQQLPKPAVPVPPPLLDTLPFDPGQMVVRYCLNGPCQNAEVHAPMDATPGTACALGWQTTKGAPRFAVYVLVDFNGTQGLMFLRSYDRPEYAQAKVQRITAICAAGMA